MTIKRRTFLKGSLTTGALGVAVGAGLLQPRAVLAAWPDGGFAAKSLSDAMSAIGAGGASESAEVVIKAPDIAENGAVVPITVSTNVAGAEMIALFVEKNPQPLVCSYDLTSGCEGYVSTRIKMGETSDIVAVIKAGGKTMLSKKMVKVTIGGCGG